MPGINASQVGVSDEALQTTTSSDILYNVTTALFNQTNETGAESDPVKAKIKEVFNIAVLIVLCVLMMSIGAVIKLDMIKAHFRRPVGIVIGMVCQFIVLPVVAFGLAHALHLERWSAIGMILIGTTPGRSTSNMFTFYVDGGVPLSVSMTATSTVIGVGMMPLNAWIYTRSWADYKTVIPYKNIIIILATMLIPVAIGMVILAKLPKLAKWITRIGSVLGFVLIVSIVAMLFYVYPMMFRSNWKIWIGSVVVLIIPVTLSFIAATIFCLPLASRKAISIETGVQNTGLCLALIAVSYDINLFVQISKFPILYSLINFSIFWVLIVLYRVVKLIRKHRGLDENKARNPDDDEMKPTADEEKFEKSSLGKSDAGDLELHVTLL